MQDFDTDPDPKDGVLTRRRNAILAQSFQVLAMEGRQIASAYKGRVFAKQFTFTRSE